MKIACLSMCDPSLGRFAMLVGQELAALGNYVEMWFDKGNYLSAPIPLGTECPLPNREFDVSDAGLLSDFDAVIYHINSGAYSAGVYQMMTLHRGVVVLHDVSVGSTLASGVFPINGVPPKREITKLYKKYYGEDFDTRNITTADILKNYGLLETVVENSEGIVCHSEYARKLCLNAGKIPTICASAHWVSSEPPKPLKAARTGEKNTLLSVTFLDSLRRFEPVLQALASDKTLRDNYDLYLAGRSYNTAYPFELYKYACGLGVKDNLYIMGYAPYNELKRVEDNAVIRLALRYPNSEGHSSAAFASLNTAVPTMVTDIASFSEYPDDAVLKVRLEHEVEDIRHHLHTCLEQPELMRETGLRGREYLLETRRFSQYAAKLNDFLIELHR